jgi:hypothetical protein
MHLTLVLRTSRSKSGPGWVPTISASIPIAFPKGASANSLNDPGVSHRGGLPRAASLAARIPMSLVTLAKAIRKFAFFRLCSF